MALVSPKCEADVFHFLSYGGYLSLLKAKQPGQKIESFLKIAVEAANSNPEHVEWLRKWRGTASIPDSYQDDIHRLFFRRAWHLYCNNPISKKCPSQETVIQAPAPESTCHSDTSRFRLIPEANEMQNFAGIPSCPPNSRERSDSPLSSLPDENLHDSNKITPVGGNRDAISDVPFGFQSGSSSPLSDLPDQDNLNYEVPKARDSGVRCLSYNLRSRTQDYYNQMTTARKMNTLIGHSKNGHSAVGEAPAVSGVDVTHSRASQLDSSKSSIEIYGSKKASSNLDQRIIGQWQQVSVDPTTIPSTLQTPTGQMELSNIDNEHSDRGNFIEPDPVSDSIRNRNRHYSSVLDLDISASNTNVHTPDTRPATGCHDHSEEVSPNKARFFPLDVEPAADPAVFLPPVSGPCMLQHENIGTSHSATNLILPPPPLPCTEYPESLSNSMSMPSDVTPSTDLFTPTSDYTLQTFQLPLVDVLPSHGSYNGPPWLQSIDPLGFPSSARGPGERDTHFWHVSRDHNNVQTFPSLPPLCFPRQFAQLGAPRLEKPPLPTAIPPPVWAQSRQELCESLPYFRAYQGGVYSRGKRALGYLLDGHPAAQDLWHAEGRLIISHAGGNSAVDKNTKQTVLVDDQTMFSVSCSALLNSFACKQPIVLIAGNGYNLFPFDLEHRSYVVLGYYLITQAWEEPEPSTMNLRGYFVRWKFLFQWIEGQGQPWWIQESTSHRTLPPSYPSQSTLSGDSNFGQCSTCGFKSPEIYKFGWVCTSSTCPSFFRRNEDQNYDQVGYNARFLILRRDLPKYQANRLQTRPGPPVHLVDGDAKETTTRRFWNGFWCENCGRLSCREQWTHWECRNCQAKLQVKHRLRSVGDSTLAGSRVRFKVGKNSGIKSRWEKFYVDTWYRCRIFELPWKRGVIYLMETNLMNLTADKIFHQYQRDAEDSTFFRRYEMKMHKLKGRMLSHYFSQNSGEPYKYVGGTDNTVPLDKYSSVQQAVELIRKRVSVVLCEDPLFNEVLSVAYMADQKMEFHSDGEKNLGPVIASLSLGAPATMRFRAVPARIKHDSTQLFDPNAGKIPTALTLTLKHGDVLIMAGGEIQEYYQHAVHPLGFRIAATARYIRP